MTMRTAIYVRVSTQRQSQTQTIDQQLDRLRRVVADRGEQLADDHVFRDDGYSGASLRRPGLDKLRDLAALARLDRILITDPDRLARNYVHQVLLLEELQRHGCRVEFTDRPLSDDPQDHLLLQIRGAVAEYERTLIAERTRRGRLHKLRTGQMLPWTRPPFGYRADPDRPRDPAGVRNDPTEAAVVADLFRWYADEGRSLMAAVKRLHDLKVRSPTGREYWGVATVRGVLSNPTYTGTIYANRTRVRPARLRRSATHPIGKPRDSQVPLPPDQWIAVATVPAIVTRELFDRVRAKIATNRSFARRNNTTTRYLLRALVSCGMCRLACIARRTLPGGKTYYLCSGKSIRARQDQGCRCRSKFIPAGVLDDLVWADLCDLLLSPERVAEALRRATGGGGLPQELQARRENLRGGRASLARQIERLTEAYLAGVLKLAEYDRRRKELERRDGTLAEQEELLAGETSRAFQVGGLVTSAAAFAGKVRVGLDAAAFERRRQLVELLIDRVVVTGDNVEIRYAFPIGPAGEAGRFCHLRVDYLRAPLLVRPRRCEVPAEHVLGDRQPVPRVGRPDEPPRRLRPDAAGTHQLGHGIHTARDPAGGQLGVHPRAAVAALHLGVDLPDPGDQLGPPGRRGTRRSLEPGVVARPGHAQRSAHDRHGVLLAAFFDPGEGYFVRAAKNAVAFFRMSRSISSRFTSARNWRSSASAGVWWPEPGKAAAPSWRCAFFHSCRRLSWTPSRRAASATESFCSVTIWTAWSLNSGV
jgi:site-specific DNA recombinase